MNTIYHSKGREQFTPAQDAETKDLLGYLDQAFFISLRAFGRQPIMYFLWVYQRPLNEAEVNIFNERLAQGFLGRLLQRSPLPWGRHRWVANRAPVPVKWYRDEIPINCLPQWRSLLVDLPLDPEHGPGWRLAVQLLQGGGAALALIVSHTIADAKAASQAITEAVAGGSCKISLPPPSRRWSVEMVARDSMESLRALPDLWRALKAVIRQPRATPDEASRASSRQQRGEKPEDEPSVVLPLAQVIINQQACEERAASLGVKGNTLIAALAARIAFRIGRVDAAGRVELVLPVSDRRPDDSRANALRMVTVLTDANVCHRDPRPLLQEIRAALASPDEHNDMSSLLPLVPYLPLRLLRHFERTGFENRSPTGCSLLGELPPDVARPFGDASLFHISNIERYTDSLLKKIRGGMLLVSYRLREEVHVTVIGHMPNHVTTADELLLHVRASLADLGLDGHVV